MCMSEIIQFPLPDKQQKPDLEVQIDNMLQSIPKRDRDKIRFELIKTIDSYDAFFTEWTLNLSDQDDKQLKKQIYDIAHQEHDRKMRMLGDIIKLKIRALVAEYQRQ